MVVNLDYGDIIYDQPNNKSFCNKIERVQYNAALAITGAIRGTSQTKLYHELGLELFKFRRWMRRLCMFYKIKTIKLPEYLYNLISNDHRTYNTRNLYSVETYFGRTDGFKYSFFPYSISEWNKLDPDLLNTKSYSTFRKLLLKIGRRSPNHIYKIYDPLGLKLLTRLRLGFSYLNEHRFNHNFDSCINPLCSCSLEVESTKHFFLHCHHYINICKTLLSTIKMIDESILNVNDDDLIEILLFGN